MDIDFINKREKVIGLAEVMLEAAIAIEKTLETIPPDRHKEFKDFVESDPRMKQYGQQLEMMMNNLG